MMMGQVMTSVMVGLFIGLEFNTPWVTGCFGSELPEWSFLNNTEVDP
jgi:hypothetical protein